MVLLLTLLWSMSVHGAFRIVEQCYIPERLGRCALAHNGDDFQVLTDTEIRNVHRYDIPEPLRDMSQERIFEFLQKGYLRVSKAGDDYRLSYHPRLRGGGPVLAAIVYGTTKAVCYGAIAGGIIMSIRQVGKKAKAKSSKGEAISTAIKAGTVVLELGVGGGNVANHGVTVVSEALQCSKVGREIAQASATSALMVASESAIGGGKVVVAIEAAATYLSAWALTLPTP